MKHRAVRTADWFGRAVRSSGTERDTALLVVKSTLAATGAWWVAEHVIGAESPAFAPFSAVLTMNVTIHRSLWQAARYTGAVIAGVLLQAAVVLLTGPSLLAFAVVALLALTIGRWPALGEQRSQVATAAFFAFSAYLSAESTVGRATELGQIVLLVVVGCGFGLLVNLTVFPPLRYRGAEHGLRTLAQELTTLLRELADGLDSGDVDSERAERWCRLSDRADRSLAAARSGMETAESSMALNPRKLLPRHRPHREFVRYRRVLGALERTVHQLASLTRSLQRWRQEENTYSYSAALTAYGRFAAALGAMTELLTELDADRLAEQSARLCELSAAAEDALEGVTEAARAHDLPLADPSRPYGVLIVEAARLMEEFRLTADALTSRPGEAVPASADGRDR
ncbi:FUSC family protein [Streptomyces bohaiensis]|uniref:FUSC family protein n=1 Tax=Streptomyces bohaiensis TaxID=1431344 RepID=UPI003B7D007F